MLSTLLKKRKQAYYDIYFQTNWNDIKSTWEGIKPPISLESTLSSAPTVLSLDNGDAKTNPYVLLTHLIIT